MSESLGPLTVSFKGHCVQLFHSNSVLVQSSSDGSQADAFHILEYQVVLYNSGLNFSEFYCIVSNDPSYNGMLLVLIEQLSSSPRARKSLCPLEEQKKINNTYLYLYLLVASSYCDTLQLQLALMKCIPYLLVC